MSARKLKRNLKSPMKKRMKTKYSARNINNPFKTVEFSKLYQFLKAQIVNFQGILPPKNVIWKELFRIESLYTILTLHKKLGIDEKWGQRVRISSYRMYLAPAEKWEMSAEKSTFWESCLNSLQIFSIISSSSGEIFLKKRAEK